MKRIFLFVLTNFAVMAVLMVTSRLLGVDRYLTANGLNMTALAGFSLVMGFGGAIISLLMSKTMAKMSTGARVINQPQTADEAWIVQTVQNVLPRKPASTCLKSRSTTARRTPSPPAPSRIRPWSRCPPACCRA